MITLLLAIALGLVLVTDVIQQICHVPYPVFEDSENEYTVINTKKIIHMSIKEVTE